MKIYKNLENLNLISDIKAGAVGVLPTDTIYGLVALAGNQESVERLYKIKGRKPDKPFIILISNMADLEKFGIILGNVLAKSIDKYWPGPNSIIFNCENVDFDYLTRGQRSLAFRLPEREDLLSLLKATGPLVAPSANPEGLQPSESVDDAINYFLDEVDFYVDQGKLQGRPSNIFKITNNNLEKIR